MKYLVLWCSSRSLQQEQQPEGRPCPARLPSCPCPCTHCWRMQACMCVNKGASTHSPCARGMRDSWLMSTRSSSPAAPASSQLLYLA